MDQSSSAVPRATTPCLPAPSQQFGGTQQPGSNCCTPDAQQPLHYGSDRPGIQCTGSGQGCRRFFHQECSELLPDAFRAIVAEPRAEWICPECMCRQQTQLTFA
ncbi:unnamed protein product [Gongylonema pulchrum]|uniref:PHD-type domain-containing protein n=1 Tax=Gongylonema pulchrum TaxID=637853 RepID=A0A183E6M0_9BILA|nr:unnamed protein product [Gongylonema pulchrum]